GGEDDERTEASILLAGTNSEINLKENYKKRKRNKSAKFEGQRVPNLTKVDSKTTTNQQDVQVDIEKEKDDYVLSKLFKKSGVHSALQHDAIIDNSINDYVFIEAEAHRYAEEAVKALKRSAQECYSAESGIPNWGAKNIQHIRRFGSRSNKDVVVPDEVEEEQPSSSTSSVTRKVNTRPSNASTNLLQNIRERKRQQTEFVVHTNAETTENHEAEHKSNDDDGLILIRDLKDYLSAGGSMHGKATT
ncbi:unnamed protein product, partial [Adineta steineri]